MNTGLTGPVLIAVRFLVIIKQALMKRIIVLLPALVFGLLLHGQSCLPEGITFTRQSQVDSFSIRYPACTSLEGFLVIGQCPSTDIKSLEGLSQLTSIGRFFHIFKNDSLPDLYGLHNIRSIGGDLIIGTMIYGAYCGNDSLSDLSGLDNLESVEGRLVILGNRKLERLHGLERLTGIAGAVSIQDNSILNSLTGMDNIAPGSITELYFVNNPLLSDCEVQSVCEYLSQPGARADIFRNGAGCSSLNEAKSACGLGLEEKFFETGELLIHPVPASTQICIELPFRPTARASMCISGIHGRPLIMRSLTVSKSLVDIGQLPPGMYFLRVWDEKAYAACKFIKQ